MTNPGKVCDKRRWDEVGSVVVLTASEIPKAGHLFLKVNVVFLISTRLWQRPEEGCLSKY